MSRLPPRPGGLDSALSLGVVPVGAVTTDAAGVQRVGTVAEPGLEAIAALQPDLILSNEVRHEQTAVLAGPLCRG